MAQESSFSKLLTKNHIELRELQKRSNAWFASQVKNMRDVSVMRPESIMRGDQSSKGNRIIPGHMYMYIYDPKHKETLPYYDMFPMVFPFEQVKNGFLGLNLHYLDYKLRAILLDKLMQFKNNANMDETTRLRFSWNLIGQVSKFAAAKPCVKHYLYNHVKTPFKAVHSSDWATALLLPMERFQKASQQQVWADSLRIIRNA